MRQSILAFCLVLLLGFPVFAQGNDTLKVQIDSLMALRAHLKARLDTLDGQISRLIFIYNNGSAEIPPDLPVIARRPKAIKRYAPSLPQNLRDRGLSGRVVAKFLVDKKGRAKKIQVLSGPKVFHRAVIDAIKQSRFEPAMTHDGDPVEVWMTQPFSFQ